MGGAWREAGGGGEQERRTVGGEGALEGLRGTGVSPPGLCATAIQCGHVSDTRACQ